MGVSIFFLYCTFKPEYVLDYWKTKRKNRADSDLSSISKDFYKNSFILSSLAVLSSPCTENLHCRKTVWKPLREDGMLKVQICTREKEKKSDEKLFFFSFSLFSHLRGLSHFLLFLTAPFL